MSRLERMQRRQRRYWLGTALKGWKRDCDGSRMGYRFGDKTRASSVSNRLGGITQQIAEG